VYGEYYIDHYLKPETDEKGNTIYRIIPAEHCLPCALEKVQMICVRENGEYVSTGIRVYENFSVNKDLEGLL